MPAQLASEALLGREPHLTHAPNNDLGDDFIGTKARARLQGHVSAAHYARAEWRMEVIRSSAHPRPGCGVEGTASTGAVPSAKRTIHLS